jgi:uncharacterized membrane-anchored protein
MKTIETTQVDPQAVRSHARGRGFLIPLVAAWPIGLLGGVLASLVFGVGMAAGIASGLSVALGVNFVWVVVLLARDDGAVDEQVARSVEEGPEP